MTSLFGSFLGVNGGLLAHRGKDDDVYQEKVLVIFRFLSGLTASKLAGVGIMERIETY